jgi:site-specific DNA-methyltransferase (adenine-specific)
MIATAPFFVRDGITIYHARCEDVLPSIDPASVDLLLTDPPYGIDYTASDYWQGAKVEGDAERFDVGHLLPFPRLVLWGANHFCHDLPETNGWIVWDKRLQDSTDSGLKVPDAEMAWCNVTRRIRIYRQLWAGPMRGHESSFLHPTQKPVGLMRWIITQWTKPGDLILDPYMGSGPVAQACHELGRRYIGIELVEDYCNVAVSRLRQGTFDFGGDAA